MEKSDPSPTRRKVKFAPKATPRKRPPIQKTEDIDGEENASQTQYLLRRATENLGNRGNKVEKKSAVQVAFGPGATSSTPTIRTYGVPKEESKSKRDNPESEVTDHAESIVPLSVDIQEDGRPLSVVVLEDGTSEPFIGATKAATVTKKDYKEPWDYQNSLYPTTLPLRMPYSGDPDLLNEAEFGEAAMNQQYDENTLAPASDLGFMEESGSNTMYFFQFPSCLPIPKQSATSTGREKVGGSRSSERAGGPELEDLKKLPGGCMGKLLIYKSGAIKLRLGDTLYDVSSGIDCSFAQDVVAINTEEGHCCNLGDVGKRVVVTPDFSSLLNSVTDLR